VKVVSRRLKGKIMEGPLLTSFVPESVFLISVPNDCNYDKIITWRPTLEAAEAFIKIYNLNRYSELAEVSEVPFL
jgi:hypothetical protein